MALIICVTGPANTGKSSTIRQFTTEHLGYEKLAGDVLGVFPMPRRNYAIGVNSYGDNATVVREGLEFIELYRKLGVMIVASRSQKATFEEVERFAKEKRARVRRIFTENRDGNRSINAAILANIREIMSLLPGRDR
ncbi:hypothetical protein [Bradyrhizobium sp. CCGUVB14]|uniref:hypothetical protein n=1 Tax=Bradyrhizobium sp. CCGUVB14 TaxID=2949628 RepID=UPI0020B2F0AE|nr:hypothetical protein [Bradyrhizobium sp. CCGUVB14]MCP3441663.1 hypothetical protein [Bradyrhizobium sp. CCGUVB14]